MIIKSIEMLDFGKFHNKKIQLQKGINLIYGENESGKSTAFAFIDAVFYGFSRDSLKRRMYSDEREKYRPWNSVNYSGIIEVEDGNSNYYIYRDFEKDSLEFINTDEGKDLSDSEILTRYSKIKQPGAYFFNVNRDIFQSTSFIGQLQSRIREENYSSLQDLIQNSVLASDENINVNHAVNKLNLRIKEYGNENRKTSVIGALKNETEEISREILMLEEKNFYYEKDVNNILSLKKKLKNMEEKFSKSIKISEQKIYNRAKHKLKKINNTEYFYDYNRLLKLKEEISSFSDSIQELNFSLIELKEIESDTEIERDMEKFQLMKKDKSSGKNRSKNQKAVFLLAAVNILILAAVIITKKNYLLILSLITLIMYFLVIILSKKKDSGKYSYFLNKYDLRSYSELEEFFAKEKEELSLEKYKNQLIKEKRSEIKDKISDLIDRKNRNLREIQEMALKYNVNSTENLKDFLEIKIKSGNEDKIRNLEEINRVLLQGRDLESYNHNIIIDGSEEDFSEKEIENIKLEIASSEEREKIYFQNLEKLSELNEILIIKKREYEKAVRTRDNNIKALEIIESILQNNRKTLMPEIREKMKEITETVTDGKYSDLTISDNFSIMVYDRENRKYVNVENLSNGTADEIYLAFRLSMIDLFHENIPVILDDHFLQYDDVRMEKVLKILNNRKNKNQIIIFTATKRERELFDKNSINYNYIDLRE